MKIGLAAVPNLGSSFILPTYISLCILLKTAALHNLLPDGLGTACSAKVLGSCTPDMRWNKIKACASICWPSVLNKVWYCFELWLQAVREGCSFCRRLRPGVVVDPEPSAEGSSYPSNRCDRRIILRRSVPANSRKVQTVPEEWQRLYGADFDYDDF